jgi:hypothetical protein
MMMRVVGAMSARVLQTELEHLAKEKKEQVGARKAEQLEKAKKRKELSWRRSIM